MFSKSKKMFQCVFAVSIWQYDDLFFERMVVKDENKLSERVCEFLKCTYLVLHVKHMFLDGLDVNWNNHLGEHNHLYYNKYCM